MVRAATTVSASCGRSWRLRFDAAGRPSGMPRVDQGASPVSWSAWLAELDRQQLALRVSDDDETEYELIERKSLN